jgi:predicted DCC family thiol-disulfide oxidoreductase YuxK
MDLNNKYIVCFDGDCNFCNFWVRQVLKNERKQNIYFSSLNSSFCIKKMSHLGIDYKNTDYIIVLYQEKMYIKSHAISLILKQLRFPFPLLSKILDLLPNFFNDFFYDLTSKYRLKIFGKSNNCDYSMFYKKNRML